MIYFRPKLLCVDDDPESLNLMKDILENRQYEVFCAKNGRETLDIIERKRIDLVLLDAIMPDLDGFEICRIIKSGRHKIIPVIMITGLTSKNDRIKSIEAGAEDFISKPIDSTELLARIKMLLRLKTLNDQRETEMQYARSIQMSLLPWDLPEIRGGRVAFTYVPMLDIGGDFVDLFYKPERCELGFFICDVSGHGVPAAITASMVKMSLAAWDKYFARPSELLHHIQRSLLNKMGDNYITAFACHIDLTSGRIVSACAGHPPALIFDPGGDVRIIQATGKFIADMDNLDWIEDESYLRRGNRLVLYTDGVTEARNGTREFGDEGLVSIIKKNSTMAPKELCETIHRHVQTFIGSEFLEDDFTILAFDYTGID